ncbi:MAG: type II secretion system protein GspK, partial [Bdellovibrionia bacterium]
LISFIAIEVSFDATSEYLLAAEEVKRVQAFYAAKAGVHISLLRINIYQQVKQTMGEMLKGQEGVVEMIWQTPFVWPPDSILPEDVSRIDREAIREVVGESLMGDTQYRCDIFSETSKLDINDLGSPSKGLAETTKRQLIRLIENRMAADDDWSEEHKNLQPEELVNNIIDWVDADSEGRNSSDEKALYNDFHSESIPPNQPFKTVEELHMVSGMDDSLYSYLAPLITVYGVKGVQVNHASADMLRSLDPQITEEIAKLIIKRREDKQLGGPFKNEEDFLNYVSGPEVRLDKAKFNETKIPLIFDAEYNFRIKCIGMAGSSSRPSTREIIAIVYDFDKVKEKLGKIIADEKAKENPQATPTPTPVPGPGGGAGGATPSPSPAPGGSRVAPGIVYWIEN